MAFDLHLTERVALYTHLRGKVSISVGLTPVLQRSCSKTMLDVIVFLLFVPVCPAEPAKIGRKELEIILPYTLSRPVSQKEPG